jgi:hypothetical protein
MAEEDQTEPPASLYLSFPNFDEQTLGCFTPWSTGEEMCGSFYTDLFRDPGQSPRSPSVLSTDPFCQTVAEIRAALAHVALLRYSGAFQCQGLALETVYQSMYKFVELYPSFCATLIQRAWKGTRATSTPEDADKLQHALSVSPCRGDSAQESSVRAALIAEILVACPQPEF